MPNICNVFSFGVAVNAKNDIFVCTPCEASSFNNASSSSGLAFSSASSSLAYCSNISSVFPEPSFNLEALLPVCDECASSTITAKCFPMLSISE